MLVQAGLCRTCWETTLLVFPRGGSFVYTMASTFHAISCIISRNNLFWHYRCRRSFSCYRGIHYSYFFQGNSRNSLLENLSENWSSGFPTRSDTNRSVQSWKKAKILCFLILIQEDCNIHIAKIKALITAQLICAFVFA